MRGAFVEAAGLSNEGAAEQPPPGQGGPRSLSATWVRRYLAVTALVAMSLATGTLAHTSNSRRGSVPDLRGPTALPFRTHEAMSYESADAVVYVATVEELYAAVNDPANAGAALALSPGTYTLSASGPGGTPRPNGGRLELQQDMSLYGLAGDRSAAVLDTSSLPAASFNVAGIGRTGPIRVGRGSHSIQWLTILGNPLAASGIETDLAGTPTTRIRVAHVVSGGSSRGLDVRNAGGAMAGRRIEVEIRDCEFFGGTEGVRLSNFNGAHGGHIYAVMSGNRSHGNQMGCIVANNRSNAGVIYVRSNGDRFEANGAGCVIAGAIVTSGTAHSNSTTFEAYGTKFINNTGPIFVDSGGIVALGAETAGTNVASDNTVVIRLRGCELSGNQNTDFEAFGARSTAGLSGTNNNATIELHGVSKFVDVLATDSMPFEPEGTNTVTVVR